MEKCSSNSLANADKTEQEFQAPASDETFSKKDVAAMVSNIFVCIGERENAETRQIYFVLEK